MVFDDERATRDADKASPEDGSASGDRRDRRAGAAAAAGAGGAGLGAGAAAGIVGGEDAIDFVRQATGDESADAEPNLSEVQARIEAAQSAAASATAAANIDVFEDQPEAAESALPSGIAEAAGIIGDALPPLPAVDNAGDGPRPTTPGGPPLGERPQPDDLVPSGDAPGGPPSIGRPQQTPGAETEAEAPSSPDAIDTESDDDAAAPAPPAPPGAPSFPDAPAAPAPPAGASPPPAPTPAVDGDDDAIVAEAPAPPAPAPGADSSDDVVAESPTVEDAPAPTIPGAPAAPAAPTEGVEPPVASEPSGPGSSADDATSPAPGTSDDDSPPPPAPGSPGTSDESAPPVSSTPSQSETPSAPGSGSSDEAPTPPVSSEPGTPSTPDTPAAPPAPGGSDAPSAPGGSDSSSSGSSEPTPPSSSGPDSGPPAAPPSGPDSGPSSGDSSSTSSDYPYVYAWDDEGHWVDMALENDHGGVYYLRYHDDGSVYYLNEHNQYVQVHGENLPHLLYVDEDTGMAYFSKVQHHDTVYFSYDTYGNFDWVDYHDVPNYEEPPYEDEYDYPRVVEYEYGDEAWALIEMEDGRLVKYYHEGGAYWVDEYGNEEAIYGFQVPSLIYVDQNTGYAYFSVFNETEGEYRYYYIDEDGGVEYVHDYDVPGYVPPIDDAYEYPRVIDWNADEGWVIVQGEDGQYGKYFLDGEEAPVDQYGNPLYNGLAPIQGDLLYFDEHGNAWFRHEEDGNTYFMIDHDGGLVYVDYHDIPNYQDLEPPYAAHPPYFFEDYPNPFYDDLEPDGEPTFANGAYQQTYNDGQIVVTWFQEDGPYQVRYYSEEGAGGYIQLHLTYDANAYDYEVHTYPYDYFDHVEEDFELEPIDHYVDYAYLGVPYDNMEISDDYVEYYWYDDDGDVLQKTQVNRHTGEVIYEYDDLYIHVDRYGNEYYEGYPDPNWEPPAGYGEVEDYPPYGMPPYMVFGENYDYEMQYADPDEAGYELISATPADDPNQWQYIGPGGERVIVSKLDDDTYQFAYQPDPNATPGDWEMVMNVTTDQYGNYISYEPVAGDYYDEYYEQVEDYGGVIPEGAPAYFGSEEWVNPEEDPRFTLDYTETDENGAQHYVYVADFDDDGEYDYKIDVVQYPDGHVEVEYHSNEYGHEATYEIITQPNGYYGTYGQTYYVDDPQGVPAYEYEEPAEDEYPRLHLSDAEENWVIVETSEGEYTKYYDYRGPHAVDEYGNEVDGPQSTNGLVIDVAEGGAAYVRTGYPGDYTYYVLHPEGGYAEIDPNDIPGYDYEEPADDVVYPYVVDWDVEQGWAILELDDGLQVKFYENGEEYWIDQYGNETLATLYQQFELVQVDAEGNAYLRGGEPGNYTYSRIDTAGHAEVIDPHDIPDYDYEEPGEELYDTAWADYYSPNFGYDHPYDLYGQPDPPGENQAPNVYTFGGGRAMVVHNEDGSETITWYSEGGYQDGYIEYKATVEYEGGQWVTDSTALPLDLMTLYGQLPVEGTPIYDPYHANAPWGEPDSVVILEDRVITIWETDEGQIRSEWHRDGSNYREVTYPDGLVIEWGDEGWEYEVPDDWTPPDYAADIDANIYTEAAALAALPDDLPAEFAEGYPNPEAAGYQYSHSIDAGGSPAYVFYSNDGSQTIVVQPGADGVQVAWYEGQIANPSEGEMYAGLQAVTTVNANGQYNMQYWDAEEGWMDAPPVADEYEYEPDGYLPDGAPPYFGDQMWVNPEADARFGQVQYNPDVDGTGTAYRAYRADLDDDGGAEYLINVWENPDGSARVEYYYMNELQATVDVIAQPDGSYGTYNTTYAVSDYVGVPATGEYDEPEVEELDPWTAHLPPYWNLEIGTGQHTNFHNPEAEGQFVEHELWSATATERVYVDQFGQYVRIVNNGGGNFTFSWGDDLANPDLVMGVPAQGNPEIEYTSIGVVDPWAEEEVEEIDETLIEADGYLPNGAPVFFGDSVLWPNPEMDNRFEYQYQSEPEPGVIARHYHVDLDGNGTYDYRAIVMEYPDGTVYVDYGHLNGAGEARFILTQDAGGNYVGQEAIYYVNNPEGAPFESAAAESPDEDDQQSDMAPSDEATEPEAPAGDEPEAPGDPDDGPPAPPPPPTTPEEADDEVEEQLHFLSEEEAQAAEDAGAEPLEFNGPETSGEEIVADPEDIDKPEDVELVEIVQPDLVEAEEEIEPISTTAQDEADMGSDLDDDEDDDGSGF